MKPMNLSICRAFCGRIRTHAMALALGLSSLSSATDIVQVSANRSLDGQRTSITVRCGKVGLNVLSIDETEICSVTVASPRKGIKLVAVELHTQQFPRSSLFLVEEGKRVTQVFDWRFINTPDLFDHLDKGFFVERNVNYRMNSNSIFDQHDEIERTWRLSPSKPKMIAGPWRLFKKAPVRKKQGNLIFNQIS